MINNACSFHPPGQRVHLQVHHPVASPLLIGHAGPERGGVPSVHPRALHVHPLLPLAGKQRHQSRRANAGVCMCERTNLCLSVLVHRIRVSFSGTAVNAVVSGEKLSVIEFHAARGVWSQSRNVCGSFSFSSGRSAQQKEPPLLILKQDQNK